MGMMGAGGQLAMRAGLRQRIIDQMMQAKQQQELELNERRMVDQEQDTLLRGRALDQGDAFRRDQLAALEDERGIRNEDRALTQMRGVNESMPPGRYPANPATAPIMGRLEMIGAAKKVDERPRIDEGPLLPGDTGADLPAGYEKFESAGQANIRTDNETRARTDAATAAGRDADRAQRASDAAAMRGVVASNQSGAAASRDLANQMKELQITGERDKQAAATTDRTKQQESAQVSTQNALDLVDQLEKDPGLGAATGAYEVRGFTQGAQDFNGMRNQLVALLALPSLGALKGPMSDKDILFVKQLATRLENPRLSEAATRKALAEAKTFLQSKLGKGGSVAPGAGAQEFDFIDGKLVPRQP